MAIELQTLTHRRGWYIAALLAVSSLALVTTILLVGQDDSEVIDEPTAVPIPGIWVNASEIAALPITGPGWERVAEYALDDWGTVALGDQNSNHDVRTLAGALYAVRLGDDAMSARVERALRQVEGSEPNSILAVARNLLGYVVAADLIGFRSRSFDQWLEETLTRTANSRAGITTLLESASRDPSNHGAHARSSAIAVSLYLGDDATVGRLASRFHDWLGRSGSDFEWRELDWQVEPDEPRGVNRPGATLAGTDVDGVLPEEQRRSGGFAVPAPQEPYVWEGLQGAVATAELLHRAGFEVWSWEDQALLRAITWVINENDYPPEGDDRWIPWLINSRYSKQFATESPIRPGKGIGFTDWTHAR